MGHKRMRPSFETPRKVRGPQDDEMARYVAMAPTLLIWESAANSNQFDGAASIPFQMRF
jgi:hypothetical protein